MALKITCTKLGETFDIDWAGYSDEAKANAIVVGLHRIVNDAMAGVVRKDFPTGAAGDESFRDVGRTRVRVRLANLANADRKTGTDPLSAMSDDQLRAELARRAAAAKKSA
jgi:hypothetical protein